jgi:hypothetical protein
MRVIRIEESKVDKMSEYCEKMLKAGGKLMSCIEELSEGGYGERDDEDDDGEMEGMRGGYRGGYGMRDYDGYGMRRRSSRTGRYMR